MLPRRKPPQSQPKPQAAGGGGARPRVSEPVSSSAPSATVRTFPRTPARLPVLGKPSRVTVSPSSLSSLRSPPVSRPLPSTSASQPLSSRSLFASPLKVCPVCLVGQKNFSQHINTQACGQNLTNTAAAKFNYQRCSFAGCTKWVNESHFAAHLNKHMDSIPASQVIDLPPRGILVPESHASPPISPAPSSPLSRSPSQSPANRDIDVEHKDGEIKEHVDDSDVDSHLSVSVVGSLLPASYQSWPHLFSYVPRKAQDLWIQACSQVLSELRSVHDEHGDVDQMILKFLLLPRLLLRRVAGQAHADKKLARTLISYLRDKEVPHEQQQSDIINDTRSDSARRVSAATRKVKQGHVRKAVDALIQPGMLEVTIETLEQLQTLHPSASDPILSLQPSKPNNG